MKGTLNVVSEEQPVKTLLPIEVIWSGIVTSVNFVKFANALEQIVFVFGWIAKLVAVLSIPLYKIR